MRFASICASSVCVLLMLGCHHSGGPAAVHYSVIGSSDRALEPGQLVTGKHISDPEERQLVGSWPMNMIATADGRFAITTDMGFKESVWSIDTAGGLGVSHVNFSNQTKKNKGKVGGQAATETAPSAADESNGLYYGLAAAPNGTIFAAQGAHDSIAVLAMDANGGLSQAGEIATKPGDFPAGIALGTSSPAASPPSARLVSPRPGEGSLTPAVPQRQRSAPSM